MKHPSMAKPAALHQWGMSKPRPHRGNDPWEGFSAYFKAMALANMRNAWVAYHAGAPWMTGCSYGLAQLLTLEVNRHIAEKVRLRGLLAQAFEAGEQVDMDDVLLIEIADELTRGDCSQ